MSTNTTDTSGMTVTQGTEGDDFLAGVPEQNDLLRGLAGNDILDAGPVLANSNSHDILDGGDGDDMLHAERGSSTEMLGGAGNDTIELRANNSGGFGTVQIDGGAGDDNINLNAYGPAVSGDRVEVQGGIGNDTIMGSMQAETFIFSRGDGEDRVDLMGSMEETDASEQDLIRFGDGISAEDLRLERNEDQYGSGYGVRLVILDNGVDVGDRIIMEGMTTERLQFADGSELNLSSLLIEQKGTGLDDYLDGTMNSDWLRGFGGNDTLNAGPADPLLDTHDVLDGGAGNDHLTAERGNSTEMLGGDGDDSFNIMSGPGTGTGTITIDGGAGMDNVNIDTGYNTVASNVIVDTGADDDRVQINAGWDALSGDRVEITTGTGNDEVMGSSMAETFVFNRGDGADRVDLMDVSAETDASEQDAIQFGAGISLEDLRVSQVNGSGIQLFVMEDGVLTTDSILMEFSVTDHLAFADGSVARLADVDVVALPSIGTDGDDVIFGTSSNDLIVGGVGNDTLDVAFSGGLDKLFGGEGNDVLRAEGGASAVLDGGSGSDQIEVVEGPMGTAGIPTTVIGGTGNDFIMGSSQAEVFVFNRNDGMDWINDSSGAMDPAQQDRLLFGEGISAADLAFSANPFTQDLMVSIMENGQSSGDAIMLMGGQMMDGSQIELLEFSDGSVVQLTDIWIA